MGARSVRRAIVLCAALAAVVSCDALVGIGKTSVAHGGAGGVDASAGAAGVDASAGAGGLDAAVDADAKADTGKDAIADAPSDQNVGPPPSQGLGCALWPGGVPVTVGCKAGQVITGFSSVFYGTPTGSCSKSDGGSIGTFKAGACNAAGAKLALETLCKGFSSCTFTADANLDAFTGGTGDPCPGTSKFIAAQVECGPAPVPEAGSDAGSSTLGKGMILDLDGSRFTSTAVGSGIATWDDDSPSATPLNATTPSGVPQPTVGHDQTSGLGLVHFSGSQYMVLPTIPESESFSSGFTAFAVIAPDNLRSWQRIFDFGNGAAQDNVLLAENGTSRSLTFQTYRNSTAATSDSLDTFDTNELQLFAVRGGLQQPITTEFKVVTYKGGMPVYEQFMPAPSDVARSGNLIGKSNWIPDALYQGYIAQLVVYDRALDDAEMTQGNQTLMSRWKLCSSANTDTDPANCGYCGHLCSPGQQCQQGVCTGSLLPDCAPIAVGGSGSDYALCQASSSNKVSWVQARNACVDMGGDLMSLPDLTTSNTAVGASGGPVLVGLSDFGTNSFYWSDSSSVSFTAWPGDGGTPATDQELCAVLSAGGKNGWRTGSCTTAQADPWLCKLSQPAQTCGTWLDPTSHRAYAICTSGYSSNQLRRDECASMNGTLISVKDQPEATTLGLLLTRIDGNVPASAIDLTDGVTPLEWTLESGGAAPFWNWMTGEPQVGNEPRCGTLTPSGQTASVPCDGAAEPMICSLPDGTLPNETIGSVAPSYSVGFQADTISASIALDGGGNTEAGVAPGGTISASVTVSCGSTLFGAQPVSAEISFSPGYGTWKTCLPAASFPCKSGTPAVTTVPAQLQAPPLAGVFDVGIQFTTGSGCGGPVGDPGTFGRIAVAAP
jgi:Galactose binding lectin domain/Concanavalin A-like lectin/glucanases superfamily/Lectin C-type domain